MSTYRFYVVATEDQLFKSGVSSATPAAFFPETGVLTALSNVNKTINWVVYESYEWALLTSKQYAIPIIEIESFDFEAIGGNWVKLTKECAGKISSCAQHRL